MISYIKQRLNSLSEKRKAALTIVAITPFLTELLCGNSPPRIFFHPLVFIAFIIIYGCATLLIREFSVRYNLSKLSIFILGIGYGIYNEGIVAKTLLNRFAVPLDSFNDYGYTLGINFTWLPVITVWHALHSVLFPILIVHFLFPTVSKTRWLGKKGVSILFFLCASIGILFYAKGETINPAISLAQNTPWHFIAFVATMGLIAWGVTFLPKTKEGVTTTSWSIKAFFFGLLYLVLFIILLVLSSHRVPLLVFYSSLVAMIVLYGYVVKAKNWLSPNASLCLILGFYIADATFNAFSSVLRGLPDGTIAGVVFDILFVWCLWKIRHKSIQLNE